MGNRRWAPRWAKLALARASLTSARRSPVLFFYWFEFSTVPSSYVVLDNCVAVPNDSGGSASASAIASASASAEWNSFCFDIVHLPASKKTRSVSSVNLAERDKWIMGINTALAEYSDDTEVNTINNNNNNLGTETETDTDNDETDTNENDNDSERDINSDGESDGESEFSEKVGFFKPQDGNFKTRT